MRDSNGVSAVGVHSTFSLTLLRRAYQDTQDVGYCILRVGVPLGLRFKLEQSGPYSKQNASFHGVHILVD